jgi:CDGSH-type Zn-finger protein
MSQPKVADTRPTRVSLEAGTHAWCACGESKNQPFCDGSHKGGPFSPVVFTLDQPKEASLCMCKTTKTPPYCDGSHKTLPVPPA